jgi:hypothetical protein
MMRRLTGALVITASSALLVACPPGTSSVPSKNLLDLINEKRAAAGCAKVSGNDQLRVTAERHAVDIRDHPGHFGAPGTPPLSDIHIGTDGSNPGSRIDAAGYSPKSRWGEIVYTASGPPSNTEQATIDWWMNSAPIGRSFKTVASRMLASACSTRAELSGLPSWTSQPTECEPNAEACDSCGTQPAFLQIG